MHLWFRVLRQALVDNAFYLLFMLACEIRLFEDIYNTKIVVVGRDKRNPNTKQ